jgi:hypothetical protein
MIFIASHELEDDASKPQKLSMAQALKEAASEISSRFGGSAQVTRPTALLYGSPKFVDALFFSVSLRLLLSSGGPGNTILCSIAVHKDLNFLGSSLAPLARDGEILAVVHDIEGLSPQEAGVVKDILFYDYLTLDAITPENDPRLELDVVRVVRLFLAGSSAPIRSERLRIEWREAEWWIQRSGKNIASEEFSDDDANVTLIEPFQPSEEDAEFENLVNENVVDESAKTLLIQRWRLAREHAHQSQQQLVHMSLRAEAAKTRAAKLSVEAHDNASNLQRVHNNVLRFRGMLSTFLQRYTDATAVNMKQEVDMFVLDWTGFLRPQLREYRSLMDPKRREAVFGKGKNDLSTAGDDMNVLTKVAVRGTPPDASAAELMLSTVSYLTSLFREVEKTLRLKEKRRNEGLLRTTSHGRLKSTTTTRTIAELGEGEESPIDLQVSSLTRGHKMPMLSRSRNRRLSKQ